MAIPTSAIVSPEVMDPYDIVDFKIDCTGLLEPYEMVSTYVVQPLSESVLLGLELAPAGYPTTLELNKITFWARIATVNQSDTIFQNEVLLPLEISITTNAVPPRKRQRTVVLRVTQK